MLLGVDELLGFVLLGGVELEVVELLDGFVELEVLVLDAVELVLVEESTVLLSDGAGSEETGASGSEDSEGFTASGSSSTGTSDCSSIEEITSDSGTGASTTDTSLPSGTETALSVVPVSTIKEDSSGNSPAFSTPLRRLASPPMKTSNPQTPTTSFFMNWFSFLTSWFSVLMNQTEK